MSQDGYRLASFEVIPTHPKSWLFRGQEMKIPGAEIVVYALKFGKRRAKIAGGGVGAKFVTPFSSLANNKRSLSTNSTTPDRLR